METSIINFGGFFIMGGGGRGESRAFLVKRFPCVPQSLMIISCISCFNDRTKIARYMSESRTYSQT